MNLVLTQEVHIVKGLDPVADAFASTVSSDVVSMANAHAVTFIIYKGVGTTGTSTVTVEACDNTTPSNTTAVPFRSRACTSGDTWGALTQRTTAGFTTTAGSSQLYAIEVDANDLASTGYKYVRLKCVESVDDPVLGGILVVLHKLRYPRAITGTQIT